MGVCTALLACRLLPWPGASTPLEPPPLADPRAAYRPALSMRISLQKAHQEITAGDSKAQLLARRFSSEGFFKIQHCRTHRMPFSFGPLQSTSQ